MFTGGFEELGLLLFLAFLLFGPKKLPEIARVLGKGMAELRRASWDLRSSLEEEIRNLDRVADNPVKELPESVSEYGNHDSEPTPTEPDARS